MWSRTFWRALAERAGKTFAQALVAALGVGAVGITDMPWLEALNIAAGATVLSLLTNVGTAAITNGSPSLTDAERLTGSDR